MKRYTAVFIVLSLLVVTSVSAQPRLRSALTITAFDKAPMEITMNGKIYEASRGEFSYSRLRPGNHRIMIARSAGRHGRMQPVYSGTVFIPRATHVIARLNRHDRLVIADKLPIRRGGNYDDRYRPPQNNTGPHYSMVNIPSVVNAMNHSSFESDKLTIAKQALRNNHIDAAGVERIARQFSFESSRLEFAKYAYSKCVDQQNYYRVNSVFDFSSSVRKLNEFINSHQGNRNRNY